MTPEEAYRKGQRDMRDRIEKQWRWFRTDGVGGTIKVCHPKRKPYGNVSVLIRRENKVRDLSQ